MLSLLRHGPSSIFRACSSSIASTLRSIPSRAYATDYSSRERETSTSEVASAYARTSTLFKTYKPVSPGIRHLRRPLAPHLYQGRPLVALTVAQRKSGGRNCHGRITVRSRGGGHKRRIRMLDFHRDAPGPHDVVRIEYDPGRSAHIALVRNRDAKVEGIKKWAYILAHEGMRAGQVVESFRHGIPEGMVPGYVDQSARQQRKDAKALPAPEAAKEVQQDAEALHAAAQRSSTASLALGLLRGMTIKPGNVLPLRLIPTGTVVHCISLKPDGRGMLVRAAGTFAQIVFHEEAGQYSHVRLQSGEVRRVLQDCCATIGKVSNPLWKGRSLGKAGRSRWLGRRPHVRGMAMNACDHPHGGGRGKSKGNKQPRSIWGWLCKGKRTRKPGPKGPKGSNQMVVRERPRGKEKRAN